MVGYLAWLGVKHPKTYAQLLGKLLDHELKHSAASTLMERLVPKRSSKSPPEKYSGPSFLAGGTPRGSRPNVGIDAETFGTSVSRFLNIYAVGWSEKDGQSFSLMNVLRN
jgi:hypothetical protein